MTVFAHNRELSRVRCQPSASTEPTRLASASKAEMSGRAGSSGGKIRLDALTLDIRGAPPGVALHRVVPFVHDAFQGYRVNRIVVHIFEDGAEFLLIGEKPLFLFGHLGHIFQHRHEDIIVYALDGKRQHDCLAAGMGF